GKDPRLLEMVRHLSDEHLRKMRKGGHDPEKVYAAYKAATESVGKPTVILAKTIKGYGMGPYGEASMAIHQQKKLDLDGLKYFRDRFSVPISDEQLEKDIPFYRPAADSEVMQYMHARRTALGGYLPTRRDAAPAVPVPELSAFDTLLQSTGDREMSTTMAFGRLLAALLRDKALGKRIVPIIPDEARTFGLEGLFRQVGIYDPAGQLYEPIDANQVMWYKQAANGQVLEEGINEAGAMSSWIAAGTAYANHGVAMVPFYIYYSMFGYQRIGDLAWAAGDIQARGFLMGATAGRTTLAGEGLQHQDGHNLLAFGQIPNCLSYDPTFAYELAVIVHDGLKRMIENRESVFYYITVMNENYAHPKMPQGVEEGIIKGLYRFRASEAKHTVRAQLMGSGTILREVIAAAELLESEWGVAADVWSATSFNLLYRDGMDCERWNTRHPEAEPRVPYVTQCLEKTAGPIIAATDYVRAIPEQVRAYLPGKRYLTLGTDGFGRSDTRQALRRFFEVDRWNIVLATLKALADEGSLSKSKVSEAIAKYGIDADKPNPMTV
ncbi:MAG: transketolase-like TK C-terminal-containing protein, partial [Halothiobacillaceae bacterium]